MVDGIDFVPSDRCFDLFGPVLGARRARKLIDTLWALEEVKDVRTLRPLLQPLR